MANNIIKRVWNQNRMVSVEDLSGMAFQDEKSGHTFEISGIDDNGNTVALSGTVAGVFRRPDNADIALTGAAANGKVSVTLSEDCYAVPGRFGLTIFASSNGQKVCVYAAVGTVGQTSGGAVAGDTPQDVVDLINEIEDAIAAIPASYSNVMNGMASTYSTSGTYKAGDFAWYDGVLYQCIRDVVSGETFDSSKWRAYPLAKGISESDAETISELATGNAFDIIPFCKKVQSTGSISFDWDVNQSVCRVHGSTTSATLNNIFRGPASLPRGMEAGKTYKLFYSSTNVTLQILKWVNGEAVGTPIVATKADTVFTLPSDTTGLTIRLYVLANTTLDETVRPMLYEASNMLNSEIVGAFGFEQADDTAPIELGEIDTDNTNVYRRFNIATGGQFANAFSRTSIAKELLLGKQGAGSAANVNVLPFYVSLTSVTKDGLSFSWTDYNHLHVSGVCTAETFTFYSAIVSRTKLIPGLHPGDFVKFNIDNMPSGGSVHVYLYENGSTTSSSDYKLTSTGFVTIPQNGTGIMVRFDFDAGTNVTNGQDIFVEMILNPPMKHVRILCIGNSYTNDCTAYSPLIAESLSENVAITMGTSYLSGATIAQYYELIQNDNASVFGYYKYRGRSQRWDSKRGTGTVDNTQPDPYDYSGLTLKQIIADEPWDIITFQQGSTVQGSKSTFANLNSLITQVVGAYRVAHGKGVRVGWLMPQLRYSYIDPPYNTTFEKVVECVQDEVLAKTPIDFVIPCCCAIQNARDTSLDNIGASGHLTADVNGHLQAGLPSLIASWVTAVMLLDFCGEKFHGILNDQTKPTDAWISEHNTPGENGTSVGLNIAGATYLGSKCAIAAIKKPFETSTIA